MHFSGILVAEQSRGLAQAHRQVAVGTRAVQEHLILERTGHGAQRVDLLVLFLVAQNEHALLVMVPVAGNLIEVALRHIRSLGQQIAAFFLGILHEALQGLKDLRTLGQHDRKPLADIIDRREILELSAEHVVVPLFGFLLLCEVFLQLGSLRERNAVNALKRLVLGIPAPVGRRRRGQLDRLDAARRQKVRSGAQIHIVALAVKADLLTLPGVLLRQLHLIGLVLLLHQLFGLLRGKQETLERQVLLDDLLHFGLDLRQVLLRHGPGQVEIVIKAVFHGRADAHFRAREKMLHRLGHNMGSGVPIGLLPFRILERQDLHPGVLCHRRAQVDDLAVKAARAGGPVQAGAQGFRDVGDRGSRFELPDIIFQGYFYHDIFLLRKLSEMDIKKAPPQKGAGLVIPRFHPVQRGASAPSSIRPITVPAVAP